ncbi:MAG: PAS domain S-box protein [Chlorobiales bacterium]|nr:PAS domain S-box protein [Chlorobiales bacterium]
MTQKKKTKTGGETSAIKERLTLLESQFESIINHSADSVIVVDSEGIIEFGNRAACQLFNPAGQTIIGESFGHPIVSDNLVELDIPQSDGSTRIVEMRASESTWNNKKAWIVTLRDITDRKQTQEALQESQIRLKTLVQNVPGVVYQHINHPDGSGRFLYISPQCKSLYELDQQTILEDERALWKCHHPDETVELVNCLREHAKTLKPLHWEGRLLTPSGLIKWIRVAARPQKQVNGDITWDGLILDITDKKTAEAQVLKLTAAVEQSGNIVVLTSPNGAIEYVNRKFTEVTGYTPADAIGKNPRVLKSHIHPPEYYKHLWETILSGNQWVGELCNRKKDGDVYWESASISAIKDDKGIIVNYIAIKNDITEEKKIQTALREQEMLIRSVFKTLTTGICITDKNGFYVEVNDAYCRLYGYTREELIGKRFIIVVPENEKATLQSLHNDFIEGNAELPGVARVVRKDGSSFFIEFSGGLIIHEDGSRFKVTSVVDITDRLRAESALRQSEEQYREIVETAVEGIWVINKDTSVNFVNRRMAEMLGYSSNEILGKNVAAFVVQEDLADFISYIEKQKKDIAEERDFRFQRKDGSTLWGLISIRAKFDYNGVFAGALGMVSDITERKQAEEDLKNSQQRLKRFFDQTFLAVIECNLSFEIADWNPAAEKIFGYQKEDVIGKQAKFLIADSNWKQVQETWLSLIHTGQGQIGICDNITKDRRNIVCNWHNTPLTNDEGNIIGLACFAEDITERKKAEAALLQSQKSLAAVLESIDAGVISIDTENNITMFNRSAEKIFGYTSTEIIGIPIYRLLPEAHIHEYLSKLEKFRCSGKASFQPSEAKHFMGLKKNGHVFPVEISASKIEIGQQEIITILIKDITERKIMEEQILRTQRMESIGLLASGIAHDMNNILTPLTLSLDLLKMHITTAKGLEYLNSLTEDIRRATDLISQLLAFARGRGGKRTVIHLRRLIIDFERLLRETFPKFIQVKSSLSKDIPMIMGDQTQVHQVLMNLCVNAKDAMPQGGQILIKAEPFLVNEAFVRMNLSAKVGLYVRITVKDTGVGIPDEILAKIFEPFFTTKQHGQGTGLGLVTVYSIVHSHGGFIKVYSAIGKGTSFEIYLPAVEEINDEPQPSRVSAVNRGNGELILVVDDEQSIRDITINILNNYGYQGVTACNGSEAVAVYAERKNTIHAVILDMMMPVMDGFATIHALRNLNPEVKIITVSGLIDKETMLKGANLKVDGILSKPYTSEALLTLLHNVINNKS